ncbi:hypothetical protein CEXT_667421 [Caerostris extrusa]|uniref:Uncharacterized protein n=1 Tax=Caerostris extrusa TaxID=172846 RepID=A0AAV4UW04_CAEEX|nr:hypothetical protein CEXT_667421 [Caerostris extrusa]
MYKHVSDTLSLSHLRNSRIGLVKYDAATQLRCPSAAIKRCTGRRALQFARLEPTGSASVPFPAASEDGPIQATGDRCALRAVSSRPCTDFGWLAWF